MAVVLAVSCAITYGFADFSGGLASRRVDPVAVTASAQLVGLLLTPVPIVLLGGDPVGLGIAVAAGVFGGIGLLLYFTALSRGQMGVVSPLSAAAAAGVPVSVGLSLGEEPTRLALLGIAIALPAIWLAARPVDAPQAPDTPESRPGGATAPGVVLGLLSGLAFGLLFVLLDMTPEGSGAWPLLGSKIGSLGVVVALALARGRNPMAVRSAVGLVLVSGMLDMVANLLFLLATRQGLLSLVSVISSQYPVVVVILSVLVLRERMATAQRTGVVLALVAVALISVG